MSESNTSDVPSYRPTKAEALIAALRRGVGKDDEGEGHAPTEDGRGTSPPPDKST